MDLYLPTKEDFDRIEQKLDRILNAKETVFAATPAIKNEGDIDFAVDILSEKAALKSKPTIYRWSHEGRIPCVKRGKKLWFNREELEAWINDGMPHIGQRMAAKHLSELTQKTA